MRRLSPLVFLLVPVMLTAPTAWAGIESQRPLFARAEQALAQGRLDEVDRLLQALQGYPLRPWLLAKRIAQAPDDGAAADFLARYPWTRKAETLRSRWLETLAARGDWPAFERHYRDTDDAGLQCGHYLALLHTGRAAEAYAGAEKLWATGATLPAGCERLFQLWRSSPGFDAGQIWKRYGLALHKNNADLMSRLATLLPPGAREYTAFWRMVHESPRLVLDCARWTPSDPVAGRIFAHGVERLAASEPLLAVTAWSLHQSRFPLSADTVAQVDRKLTTALATERYDQALAYLLAVPSAHADAQTRAWRVRAALRRQYWPGVLEAWALLSPEERNEAQWLYWRGRALESLGEHAEAAEAYRRATSQRDFYGYLAADRLSLSYPLQPGNGGPSEAESNLLADTEAFRAIREWRALGRDGEARSEFAFIVKNLAPRERLVAAKLAQAWGWDALAISAVAKSGSWDDLTLRYPLAFQQPVLRQAQAQELNPALLFGLIRRESAFDPHAGSSVGARGLMQIMPATGAQLARRFNETLPSDAALYEPERNLRYGSAYLRGLLDRFGQHVALAAAGYNAGPNRVDRWLPAQRPLPADIWIETIPFAETRHYVAAVVAHAAAYQLRLGLLRQRISDWLPEVRPGPKAEVKADRVLAVPACD
jgi:soluble lytic murein transglycosylase